MSRQTVVEAPGMPWPAGDWATLRSSARQADALAEVLDEAAGQVVGAPAGVWEGQAAAEYDAAAQEVRRRLLDAAGSIRRVALALLPLARVVEGAQERAERALRALEEVEQERRVLLGPYLVPDLTGAGGEAAVVPQALASEVDRVQEACRLARDRAERECAEAAEAVRRADRMAAAVVEDEAMRAPVCVA
ncbi:MAG: hypothetical protein ACRDKW_09970, partial [Actinomycetota bacterium]